MFNYYLSMHHFKGFSFNSHTKATLQTDLPFEVYDRVNITYSNENYRNIDLSKCSKMEMIDVRKQML